MAFFDKKFATADGDTYAYDYVPPKEQKAVFLLIHGYPSSRYDWRYQVTDLTEAGFGVIAPDCLGYGDSDKRVDIEAYRLKRLSGHFAELLDHENIKQVVGVGHDWGSMVLSRFAVWQPHRIQKLVFLSAGYCAPGIFFDVDGLNVLSQKLLGYMQLGYWYFFNSYDAEEIMTQNLESFFHLAYPDNNEIWISSLAAINGTRSWLTAKTKSPLPSYLTEEDKARWLRINSQKNTIAASLNYYRSLMRGTQAPDEDPLTDADRTLKVPVLGMCGGGDMVTRADQIGLGTRPFASKGYTEKVLEGAGHWIMLERREEVSTALLEFVAS
ncbi:alpha/beta-hydrolase [Cadophora sp. DSE1049]|nr:alpha/beta-hydrolase [Cadophora sp. DSE1049]